MKYKVFLILTVVLFSHSIIRAQEGHDSAEILQDSEIILDEVVDVLEANP